MPLSVEGKVNAYTSFVVACTDIKNAKRGKIDYVLKAKSKEAELADAMDKLGIT